ncbi:Cloroperoxidase [Lentinula raphanica]|nr:Cloroperoxidase [Lentinula raphanica]
MSLLTPTTTSRYPQLVNTDDDCFNPKASAAAFPATARGAEGDHPYIRPTPQIDSRAPCPGLNTLANHGYIPRSGRNIPFVLLVRAIMEVYNVSLALALMLTIPGFLLYAQVRLNWKSIGSRGAWSVPVLSYTLTLSALASFGPGLKIAHRASLVHPDYPSEKPEMSMVHGLLSADSSLTGSDEERGYFTLHDLASLRVSRESSPSDKLDTIHEQVALGESSLTWLIFAKHVSATGSPGIPLSYLEQWFGDERIPDWWTRPTETIGLIQARKLAQQVQEEMELIRKGKNIRE